MSVDTPPRRVRYARPAPRVRRLVLTEADFIIFEAIARHGPLPSSYLYEFTKHLRRDWTHLQNRLTEFYNGDAAGSYLVRPAQQFSAYGARYQHLVYDLAPLARRLLAERGHYGVHASKRCDPFVHRLMCACVGASFELLAKEHGLRYISLAEIHTRRPDAAAWRSSNPLALPIPMAGQAFIVPDLLLGLEYPGVGFRFFAIECDRNTESIDRRNFQQSSFSRKLSGYAAGFDTQIYRVWWGLPNLHVLTVTTSEAHARNILHSVNLHSSSIHSKRFAIAVAPSFGIQWRVPKLPLASLLTSPWQTINQVKYIVKP